MKADSYKKGNEKDPNLPMRKRVQSEVIAWFWVGLAFLLINGTIGQARVIPSGSMENTLLIGDHLIMSRIGYDAGVPFTGWHMPLWRNPKRQPSTFTMTPCGSTGKGWRNPIRSGRPNLPTRQPLPQNCRIKFQRTAIS